MAMKPAGMPKAGRGRFTKMDSLAPWWNIQWLIDLPLDRESNSAILPAVPNINLQTVYLVSPYVFSVYEAVLKI
jgi:hypothetical protein